MYKQSDKHEERYANHYRLLCPQFVVSYCSRAPSTMLEEIEGLLTDCCQKANKKLFQKETVFRFRND